jgi:hypothetical protein
MRRVKAIRIKCGANKGAAEKGDSRAASRAERDERKKLLIQGRPGNVDKTMSEVHS